MIPKRAWLALLLLDLAAGLAEPTGLQAYSLAELPRLRRGRLHLAASTDPAGNNADRGNYLRKEGSRAVLMQADGPGAISRIWSANPSGTLNIYFDGESSPRVSFPLAELATPGASGGPRVPDWVSAAGGGVSCWYPMPFAKSCRVEVDGADQLYYQIDYWTYPVDVSVATFDPTKAVSGQASAAGSPASAPLTREATAPAGGSATLLDLSGPHTINHLVLVVTPSDYATLRQLRLRMTWDGASGPSVEAPLLDFFAAGLGSGAVTSAPIAVSGWNLFQLDFPLPFASRGLVQLANASGHAVSVKVTANASATRRPDDGYFQAVYHARKTAAGQLHPLIECDGRGHYVGAAVTLLGDRDLKFLEGNERVVTDGTKLEGTGTEDWFDGAWFFRNGAYCNRYAGAPLLLAGKSRLTAYRWQVGDCVPFSKSLSVALQHGPKNDTAGESYRSVGYWYAEKPSAVQSDPTADSPGMYVEKADGGVLIEAEGLTATCQGVTAAPMGDRETPLIASSGQALALRFPAGGGEATLPLTVRNDSLYDVSLRLIDGVAPAKLAAVLDDQPLRALGFSGPGEPLLRLGRTRLAGGDHKLKLSGADGRLVVDYILLREVGKIKDVQEAEDLKFVARGGQAASDSEPVEGAVRCPLSVGGGLPSEAVYSGGAQVKFTPKHDGDQLVLPFQVKSDGDYGLAVGLTRGPGLGGFRVRLDGRTLTREQAIPCQSEHLEVGWRVGLGTHRLKAGQHELTLIAVAARAAQQAGPLGVDWLLVKPATKAQEAEALLPASEKACGAVIKERFGAEARWSGGAYLRLPGEPKCRAEFLLFAPRTGRYKVKLIEARVPTGGKFRATLAGSVLGEVDCKAPAEAVGTGVSGRASLARGGNLLTLTSLDGADMALDALELEYVGPSLPLAWLVLGLLALALVARQTLRHRGEGMDAA